MSKNLVKSYYTTKESSTPRIIDGNATVEEVLERIRYIYPEGVPTVSEYEGFQDFGEGNAEGGFQDGIGAEELDGLLTDREEGPSSNVIKAAPVVDESQREAMLQEIEEIRQQMLEEAQADIAIMKNQAAEELARDRSIAIEEAKIQGYNEGMNRALVEIEEAKRELEAQKNAQDAEYEELLFDLEPQFVRHITNIYEKVFQVDLSEEKSIVVNLLRNAMQRIEGSNNYLIHVSEDDYESVSEKRDELTCAAAATEVVVDIIEDITLRKGECYIETANGIFDCGIDTQLAAIKKKLMLLSYNGND